MRNLSVLIFAALVIISVSLFAQESKPKESRDQQDGRENAQPADTWTKTLKDRAKRGTLHDAFQNVRGDSGKWNDEPLLQHAPPIEQKPAKTSLDDWADKFLKQDVQLTNDDDNWLLLRTRQLDDNDRVWVERIERRGNQFTVVVSEAIWQGRYSKTFTYYSAFGVNLGKLAPGKYEAKCIIKPLSFEQFEGDGRPNDNWPKDERPTESKPVELRVTFSVAAKIVSSNDQPFLRGLSSTNARWSASDAEETPSFRVGSKVEGTQVPGIVILARQLERQNKRLPTIFLGPVP